MSQTTKKNRSTIKSWKLSPKGGVGSKRWYSPNDVINAYLKGRRDQKDANEKILEEQFDKNLKAAKKLGIELFNYLLKSDIKCYCLELKPANIVDFDYLFVVSEKDFISDSFKDIYKFFRSKRMETNNDSFKVYFSFMPYTENIDEEALLSDGYVLRYGKAK